MPSSPSNAPNTAMSLTPSLLLLVPCACRRRQLCCALFLLPFGLIFMMMQEGRSLREWQATVSDTVITYWSNNNNNNNGRSSLYASTSSASASSSGASNTKTKTKTVTTVFSDDSKESASSSAAAAAASPAPLNFAWLLSYPNSGTSYTMTMVERASNRSTATNYGPEVTPPKGTSVSLVASSKSGPFWEGGLESLLQRTIRALPPPESYILTKTHCGGRCIDCGPEEYFLRNASAFLNDCLRTSWLEDGHRVEGHMRQNMIRKLVHLIRNPYHNIVARFHLDRKHFVDKQPKLADEYPNTGVGFQKWCHQFDTRYYEEEKEFFRKLDPQLLKLYKSVPCHAEFFKYTKWHNNVIDMLPLLHRPPVLTVFYEDYAYKFNETVQEIMEFIQLDYDANRLRPFRDLPEYKDHFTKEQRRAAQKLVEYVASPHMYPLLQRYFVVSNDDNDDDNDASESDE